jgi:hypothetical protein
VSFTKIIEHLNANSSPRQAVDPFVASLPQNVVSGLVARQEQAEEERRVAQEAYEAAVEAAEAEDSAEHAGRRTALAEGVHAKPVRPVLHGDNGATLKATTVLAMLRRPALTRHRAVLLASGR